MLRDKVLPLEVDHKQLVVRSFSYNLIVNKALKILCLKVMHGNTLNYSS